MAPCCPQVTHSNSSRLPASPRRGARSGAGRDGQPAALMQELTSPGLLAAITARDGGSKTDIQVSCKWKLHAAHRHVFNAPRQGMHFMSMWVTASPESGYVRHSMHRLHLMETRPPTVSAVLNLTGGLGPTLSCTLVTSQQSQCILRRLIF